MLFQDVMTVRKWTDPRPSHPFTITPRFCNGSLHRRFAHLHFRLVDFTLFFSVFNSGEWLVVRTTIFSKRTSKKVLWSAESLILKALLCVRYDCIMFLHIYYIVYFYLIYCVICHNILNKNFACLEQMIYTARKDARQPVSNIRRNEAIFDSLY